VRIGHSARRRMLLLQENTTSATLDQEQSKAKHLALIGLIGGAVLLRIGLAYFLPRVIKGDEPAYLLVARSLLAGMGLTVDGVHPQLHYPPLYSIASGLFYLLTRDFETASNAAYALFGGLLLFPVFVIARRVYDTQTAWLAVILLAIFPALNVSVFYWGTMSEPLYLFLFYGGLATLLVGLEDSRTVMFALAGTLFGLAYLTRPEAYGHFLVLLVFGLIWLAGNFGLRSLRTWRAIGSFLLFFVLLAAPYVWYLHAHTGVWMLTAKIGMTWEQGDAADAGDPETYYRLANSLDASGKQIAWQSADRFRWSLSEKILADPKGFVRRVVQHSRDLKGLFFDRHLFWYGLLPLVVLALFARPWHWQRLKHEVFLMAAILPLVGFLPFYILVRYFAPAFPVLLMWMARGALDLGTWLLDSLELWWRRPISSGQVKAMVRLLPAAILVLFFLATMRGAAQSWRDEIDTFGHREAGLWLRNHAPADAKIMSVEGAVAVYADRGRLQAPYADWPRFLGYARARGASYLVVTNDELNEKLPQLAFILKDPPPELELVFSFQDPRVQTLVYRIR
jgi:4-amino-4-deoxy-L-arabinose transferase-like glycosyltransferase